MDLGTIGKNLKRAGGYASADAWMADVRQIETNAKLYHEATRRCSCDPRCDPRAKSRRDVEEAVERRAADLARADVAFDRKVLGARHPRGGGGGGGSAWDGNRTDAGGVARADGPPPPPPYGATPPTE